MNVNYLKSQSALSRVIKLSVVAAGASLLAACGGSDNDDDDNDTKQTYRFEITVTNLAHNQPLSPMGLVLHGDEFTPWEIGQPASVALEDLAEGGDNAAFIGQTSDAILMGQSGNGLIMPGAQDSVSVSIDVEEGDALNLSLATMLVNTNDAFVGANSLSLNALEMGERHATYLSVYDAGTEANDEMAGTIPGPADGGEGTNTERDDVNYVAMHPGVVGQDHGYAESVLDSTHSFDGPVARLTIERTQ